MHGYAPKNAVETVQEAEAAAIQAIKEKLMADIATNTAALVKLEGRLAEGKDR